MSQRIFENLKELLTDKNAKFRVIEHEPAGTSQSVAKARGTHLAQGAKALVCLVKGVSVAQSGQNVLNLPQDQVELVCNVPQNLRLPGDKPGARNGRIYVLAVFAADHKANLASLAAALGGTKASLASQDECMALTDCVIGSIPPFSFHDRLLLVADENLLTRYDEIAFNAGLLDRSIVLNSKDYERIAQPKFIKFADL